jgi:hypothetical protein
MRPPDRTTQFSHCEPFSRNRGLYQVLFGNDVPAPSKDAKNFLQVVRSSSGGQKDRLRFATKVLLDSLQQVLLANRLGEVTVHARFQTRETIGL